MTKSSEILKPTEDKSEKWIWVKRFLSLLLLIAIPFLLVNLFRNTEWKEVQDVLTAYNLWTLGSAFFIVLTSYIVFSTYDLIGKYYIGHSIPVRQIYPLAATCYAFNLNLSAWVGGIALRYRLYAKLGLTVEEITKVLSLNWLTNWLGFSVIAGIIFSCRLVEIPDAWKLSETGFQIIGVALLIVLIAYFSATYFSKRRYFEIKNYTIDIPSFRVALLQASLAIFNWSLMGLLMYILLPVEVSYFRILGILLISSIAGVITHIPAGLGVLETIFVVLLEGEGSKGGILAGLIAYRVFYYLIPLIIAVIIYIIMEARAKKISRSNRKQNENSDKIPTPVSVST